MKGVTTKRGKKLQKNDNDIKTRRKKYDAQNNFSVMLNDHRETPNFKLRPKNNHEK